MTDRENILTPPALVDKLVAANRILARYGIVDGFGHISIRTDESTFLVVVSWPSGSGTRRPHEQERPA